jgi:membrane protein YqaA with SNARE-associated domain
LDALPVDLPAVDFPAEDDLLAAGFAAVFEPEDLLAVADFDADVFAAGLAEADLPPVAEDDLLAVGLLLVVVDFAEFLFVVAIARSLRFFLQLTQEFLR